MPANEATPPCTQQHIEILTGPFAHWDLRSPDAAPSSSWRAALGCPPAGDHAAAPALKPAGGPGLTTAAAAASAPLQRVGACTTHSNAQGCTAAAAQPSLEGNPPLWGKVAKQPGGDVAAGTRGDVLSLLRASVPRADSSLDNTAKQTSLEPHGAALAGPAPVPAPSSAAPGAATAANKGQVLGWHKLLEPGGGRRLTRLVLLSASNQLLGWTSSTRQSRGSLISPWPETDSCSLVEHCRV